MAAEQSADCRSTGAELVYYRRKCFTQCTGHRPLAAIGSSFFHKKAAGAADLSRAQRGGEGEGGGGREGGGVDCRAALHEKRRRLLYRLYRRSHLRPALR